MSKFRKWDEVAAPAPALPAEGGNEPAGDAHVPAESAPEEIGLFNDEVREAVKQKAVRAKARAVEGAEKAVAIARQANDRLPGVGQWLLKFAMDRRFWMALGALALFATLGGAGYGVWRYIDSLPPELIVKPEPVAKVPAIKSLPVPVVSSTAPAVDAEQRTASEVEARESEQVIAEKVAAIGEPPKRAPNGFPIMPSVDQLQVVKGDQQLPRPQAGGAPPSGPPAAAKGASAVQPVKATYETQDEDVNDFFNAINESK